MSKIEKWIDLSELPKDNRNRICWKNSIKYKCKFKYDDIEGEVEIVDYVSKGQKLTIKYLDYDLFDITTGHFTDCKFGKLLKKVTNEFKVEIGLEIKDNKRDLIIIDREYRILERKDGSKLKDKWYKYSCNKCGNEDWIVESSLLKDVGCNTCCKFPNKTVLGINTIYDTDRWMIDYFGISEEDSKKYTYGSSKKIKVKCPDCGKEKYISPNLIYYYKSISCTCGDGLSYPEKFIVSLLDQLKVNYIKEYSPEWIKPKRYDFYFELDNKKIVIEVHGGQHYKSSGFSSTLKEQKQNDQYKRELALNNNIDFYIEIDCRESNLEFIKNSIINSELNKLFNLNNVNWLQCEEFSLSNRVKEICDYWVLHNEINSEELTTFDLSKTFNLNRSTIMKYLKKGSKLGWCNYNPKDERIKTGFKAGKMSGKQVEIFDRNRQSLGLFESCHELERQSEELFGVKLFASGISLVSTDIKEQYKGFTFKYIEN